MSKVLISPDGLSIELGVAASPIPPRAADAGLAVVTPGSYPVFGDKALIQRCTVHKRRNVARTASLADGPCEPEES